MSTPRAILALDLSPKSTGFALLSRDGTVRSGSEPFPFTEEEHPGSVMERFEKWLHELATATEAVCSRAGEHVTVERLVSGPRVDVIAWERIVGGGGGINAAAGLFKLEGEVVKLAYRLGVETRTVAPSTLKKHATGSGVAKKPEMVEAAVDRWLGRPYYVGAPGKQIGHDEADALCVLAWAMDELGVTNKTPVDHPSSSAGPERPGQKEKGSPAAGEGALSPGRDGRTST